MKKKVIVVFVLFSLIVLTACGKSANGKIAESFNSSLNQIKKNIEKIEEVKETDFLSEEMINIKQANQAFTQKMKDEEFVYSNKQTSFVSNNKQTNVNRLSERENKNLAKENDNLAKENEGQNNQLDQNLVKDNNLNTYFQRQLPRNVNTYFFPPHMPYPYGMNYGGMGYGGMGGNFGGMGYEMNDMANNQLNNQGQYLPNQTNNLPYNQTKRRKPNIDTYGLGTSNINTYYKNENNNKNNSSQDTDKNFQNNNLAQNTENMENSQIFYLSHLNKLNSIYSSASHLANVNTDVSSIKEHLYFLIETLQEQIKLIENSKQEFTNQQIKSIEMLFENINAYTSKINLSKNQLNFELNKIKNIKNNFLTNNSELSARYIMLANFLDTRYSYYSNISNCLNEIYYKLSNHLELPISPFENQEKNHQPIFEEQENEKNLIAGDKVNIENITINQNKTLQQQLEESWATNFEENQKRLKQENIEKENYEKIVFENEDLKQHINANEYQINTNENPLINGFKPHHTEKKEVSTEKVAFDNASFFPKLSLITKTEAEEISDFFPTDFPFTKPKKYDYLKLI